MMTRRTAPLAACAALLLAGVALPAQAQDIAITNARVVIGDGTAPIPNGTVVVRAGKVVAAGAGVPVLATPLNDLPAQFEQLGATQSNVGRMAAAGVKVALGAFGDQPRYAPQYAGNLVALTHVPGASGLTWDRAFAAISSGPAEAMGMGDAFGSLRAGRAGDVVIWDGDPLEASSGVVQVFIDGVEQPLTNHQTRLRDRYRAPADPALPRAYGW